MHQTKMVLAGVLAAHFTAPGTAAAEACFNLPAAEAPASPDVHEVCEKFPNDIKGVIQSPCGNIDEAYHAYSLLCNTLTPAWRDSTSTSTWTSITTPKTLSPEAARSEISSDEVTGSESPTPAAASAPTKVEGCSWHNVPTTLLTDPDVPPVTNIPISGLATRQDVRLASVVIACLGFFALVL